MNEINEMSTITSEPRGSFFKVIIGIIFFRLTLDLVYVVCISTTFRYVNMTLKYDITSVFLSWIVLFLCIPTVKKTMERERFSDIIVLFLIYLSFIPYTTMIAYFGFPAEYVVANTVFWCILFLCTNNMNIRFRKLYLPSSTSRLALMYITAFFVLVVLFISWRYVGFRFTISLNSVYDMRSEAKEISMPTILVYSFAASKATIPIIIVYALQRKKTFLVILLSIVQILSFSINGSKTVLFSTALTVVLFYFYQSSFLAKIPWALGGISIFAFLETVLLKSINLNAYIIRRVFFFPNQLGWNYYDYFTKNTPDYFRQSFLKWFGFSSPYESIDHLIGRVYYNMPDMGANNGLISDAITNYGIIGVIIMPMLLIFILRYFDSITDNINKKIYIVVAATFSFIMLSSFLFTTLFTHGLLAVLCIFVLYSNMGDTGYA